MKPVWTFNVAPSLPPAIEGLREIAYNLRWAWDHEAIELFRRLDADLWEASGHNPVLMLGSIAQSRLAAAAADEAFRAHLDRVLSALANSLSERRGWYRRNYPQATDLLVAYFSAEFGLTECLSIFAGGLGILAGDHLKSASDLGVPLVGVGLLYQQGYFRQYLNPAGWQQESYENNDFSNLPVHPVSREDGSPLTIAVDYPGRSVVAQVWRVDVGRTRLFLLDTNLDVNLPPDRDITDQLYGGDRDMRMRQEILLGIGGYRALKALGVMPGVYHMNEGHSAFLALEHTRSLMAEHGMNFSEARELAAPSLVFTTHTPVEAGHDYFSPDLVEHYFGSYAAGLGLTRHDFLSLGRRDPTNDAEPFCMTVLALRMAAFRNGVSRLHGQVSRHMWSTLWRGAPEPEIPITHITNGVHFRSWISAEMNQLYDRYLGPSWREEPADCCVWRRVEQIPAEELWRTHERRRERLVSFARRRLREQLERRGAPLSEISAAEEILDPEALTIGFARRFATYKRATLLLRDADRLATVLNSAGRPVQIIFAGKAHPQDQPGKELIQHIVGLARRKDLRHRLVFLEDYDMAIARYLVQGVDVWLNTPLRPQEASGTSGMKAAANGALNISTLDGWWDEAWRELRRDAESIGWAIGRGEAYTDREMQDQVESEALYNLLESDVVPLFYDHNSGRIPRRWIARMKSSLAELCCHFNTHRMVKEYTERFYLVSHSKFVELNADRGAAARYLAAWMERLRSNWGSVRVRLDSAPPAHTKVGEPLVVKARVTLGSLVPDDVAVELYYGRVDPRTGDITDPLTRTMELVERLAPGEYIYQTQTSSPQSGMHGFTARIIPDHPQLTTPFWPGLITWAAEGEAARA